MRLCEGTTINTPYSRPKTLELAGGISGTRNLWTNTFLLRTR